jgi:tetratricopeptide (TPR) repeat protein
MTTWNARENMEVTAYVDRGKYREALDRLEGLQVHEAERWQKARINFLTAYCLQCLWIDPERALDNYNLALENGYDEFSVLYNRGALNVKLGDFEAARTDLHRATSLKPDHNGVKYARENMEVTAYVDRGKYREALDRLEGLQVHEAERWQKARINFLTAYCLQCLWIDPERALDNYNLALENGYDEFAVLYNRGALNVKLGDIEAARTDLDRAASLKPDHDGVKQYRGAVFSPSLLDNNQQQIVLSSPVVATSVPKSGTMLLRNILKSILGDNLVIPSNTFVGPLVSSDYLLPLPRLTNRVYVGHIEYSEDLAEKLSSIPKIILVRDPRDNVVSYAHFMDRIAKSAFGTREEYWSKKEWDEKLSMMIFGWMNGPGWRTYSSVLARYLSYAISWFGSNSIIVRYEDIIGTGMGGDDRTVIKTMKSVMDFIGVQIDKETLGVRIREGSDTSKSGTFRMGGRGNWREEFKPQHVRQLKAVGPTLLSGLGYELNERWDLNTRGKKRTISEINATLSSADSVLKNMPVISMTMYLEMRRESEGKGVVESIIDEWALKTFIENHQYLDAIVILEKLLTKDPSNSVWNYLYGLSLHRLTKDLAKALYHYNSALENGYEEFGIKLNRGLLLAEMGNKEAAVADLERAQSLRPWHGAARESLMAIKSK